MEATAQVPGKTMLCGEYAVLKGEQALAMTLDCYLKVHVKILDDQILQLNSNIWRQPKSLLVDQAKSFKEPFIQASAYIAEKLGHGLKIDITSQIRIQDGFGSSSALRLGIILAGHKLSEEKTSMLDLANEAFQLQKKAQGQASGYDFATQALGGLVMFEQPFEAKRMSLPQSTINPIHIFTGGAGAPTSKMMGSMSSWLNKGQHWREFIKQSAQQKETLLTALQNNHWLPFFSSTRNMRQFLANSPMTPRSISQKLNSIPSLDQTWTYKTSGAGGEDALLLFAPDPAQIPYHELDQLGWTPSPHKFVENGAQIIE